MNSFLKKIVVLYIVKTQVCAFNRCSYPVLSGMFHVPLLVLRFTPFISNRIDLVLLDLQSSGALISTLALNHSTLQ